MTIKERINDDLKAAMRAKDQKTINALRLITAAMKQVEVDERITVNDERLLIILDKLAKQRKESISQFAAAARDDLVQNEQFELKLIEKYLPEPLSQEEITLLIEQAFSDTKAEKLSDMGKVMAHLKPLLQGRADLSQVSAVVRARLN